jgi:cysteine desulfurase/selenocysteine lyase
LHPQDIGILLDNSGIAVRTGHHCTQPCMRYFEIPGTVRASFALYNTKEEVDALIKGLHKAIKMLS